jgi:iron complex transport system permease protein
VNESLVGRAKLRLRTILVVGILSLVLLFILSISLGTYQMSIVEAMTALWNVLTTGQAQTPQETVVLYSRLPRTMAVIGVGAGLCLAGVALQAVIRNPLVDPYISGVSSGASVGATVVIMGGLSFGAGLALYAMPIAAFIGALVAMSMTVILAEMSGGRPVSFVLAGVMIGITLSSITTIMLVTNPDKVYGVLYWLYGSFISVNMDEALIILGGVTIIGVIIAMYARDLNVILLGDEQASHLGLGVRSFKRLMLVLTSLLTAVCVAFTGVIGFLGLIVPHTARLLVGGDHRLLIPAAVVLGIDVLLAADIVSRLVLSPTELPIGAVIAIIGGPFFAYLLIKKGREYVS